MNDAMEVSTIAVFGGSGATGKALIETALGQGLRVRALVRQVGALASAPGLDVVQGSLTDTADVVATLQGCDAAICVFGPRPPYADVFCEAATATIVAAMQQLGMRRLVCQTGGLIGDYPWNRTSFFQLMGKLSDRRWPQQASDREGQERVVMHSGLAWTIVKPPRLTNGAAKDRWTVGSRVRLGLLSSIARQDLAAFLLAETLKPQYVNQRIFIRN